MAPIDPLQLLKALSPLLSPEGGIKSVEEVTRLSSLMKKFSRKLVSRCVYVNVLKASKPDAIEEFLQKGGWETIYNWLLECRKADNRPFLIELLKLYKVLPMTVERLKENNSAKIIKALTKSEEEEIKFLASEVVGSWVKLVKGEQNAAVDKPDKDVKSVKVKKKKKEEEKKDGKHEKDRKKDEKKGPKEEKSREKAVDREATTRESRSTAKENSKGSGKETDLEDVRLPDYIRNREPSKPAARERKSTVKTYQAKFRSTGLEEAPPLPKPGVKKATERVPPLTIKNPMKRLGSSLSKELQAPTKKVKPLTITLHPKTDSEKPASTLLASASLKSDSEKNSSSKVEVERREIKLIPAKPKPTHVLTESAGFMDALVAGPAQPVRKKKKAAPKSPTSSTPVTPPSPTTVTPKLQFYKDTLEAQDENANTEKDKEVTESVENVESTEEATSKADKDAVVEGEKPGKTISSPDPKEPENRISTPAEVPSNSSASTAKRKKKKVSWAEESNLKQVYYFEMDETERVNVNNIKNFGDMKTLDRLNERQAVETARRMMGDMEERMHWSLIPMELPPALVEHGCNSREKEVQKAREESVLQEIFFSKESLPDSPHEADPEPGELEEPKVIPLEDENNPDSVVDFSMMEPPAPVTILPAALSNLVMSISGKGNFGAANNVTGMQGADSDMMNHDSSMGHSSYNAQDGGSNLQGMPGMMGMGPPGFDNVSGFHGDMNSYPPPLGHGNFNNMPPNMEFMGMQGPNPGPLGGGPMMRHQGPGRGGNRMFNRGKGNMTGPYSRGMQNNRGRGGLRNPRAGSGPPCRHFLAGSCKFEESCIYLHPGINGPLL